MNGVYRVSRAVLKASSSAFALMLIFAPILGSMPSSASPSKSARDVLEEFCDLDAKGKLLRPEISTETASLFVSPYLGSSDRTIVVIDSYVVRGSRMHGNKAEFTVEYHVWGELDSSLRFTRQEGRTAHEPIGAEESYNLILAGNANKPANKEPSTWRIELTPLRPHVNIEAVITYLKDVSYKFKESATIANANTSIAALQDLRIPVRVGGTPRQTPMALIMRFCEMDAGGEQLTHVGWQKMAALFVNPESVQSPRILVIRDFGVSNASIHAEKEAEVAVEYIILGQLESTSAIFEALPSLKTKESFSLVLTDKKSDPGLPGAATEEARNPGYWKIVGPPQAPHIKIDAAIAYVKQLRDNTPDDGIKRNANVTLAQLRGLH